MTGDSSTGQRAVRWLRIDTDNQIRAGDNAVGFPALSALLASLGIIEIRTSGE